MVSVFPASLRARGLRMRHASWAGLLLLWLPLFGGAMPPGDGAVLKAALVYKLAQFVTWPEAAGNRQDFLMCVLGEDPFDGALDRLAGRSLDQRTIQVRHFSQSDSVARSCHLLILGPDKTPFEQVILRQFSRQPILTLGEGRRFAEHGGMIQFRQQGRKMRFVINLGRVREAGLDIAAPLLSMAEVIGEDAPAEETGDE